VRFNFDEFVLATDARELRRSGAIVHLSPKAFELLQALLEHRPAALSKSDLHAMLWPQTFVTDTSLATVVSEVRRALGDSARRPRYIRTVHAYGYAFCGDATGSTSAGAGAAARHWMQWQGRTFPLAPGENILGRGASADVVVDLPEVSRRHARIHVSAERVTVEDLGSRNGTFLRDVRVTAPHPLVDGDEIRVGAASLSFHAAPGDGTTKTVVRGGDRSLKKS
jgi:DNA-binding winged helix-turn-helix (wHTH) protein